MAPGPRNLSPQRDLFLELSGGNRRGDLLRCSFLRAARNPRSIISLV